MKLEVGRIGVVGEALDIERQAAIGRVGGQKAHDLLAQRGALVGVLKHVAHAGSQLLRVRIEVVEVRERFQYRSRAAWMTCLTLFRSSGSCTVAPSITGYSRRLSLLMVISVPSGESTCSHCGNSMSIW